MQAIGIGSAKLSTPTFVAAGAYNLPAKAVVTSASYCADFTATVGPAIKTLQWNITERLYKPVCPSQRLLTPVMTEPLARVVLPRFRLQRSVPRITLAPHTRTPHPCTSRVHVRRMPGSRLPKYSVADAYRPVH